MTAKIYISGLLRLRPNHHQFTRVTQKQFWAALSTIQFPLIADMRLSESHDIVNYYVPHDKLECWRASPNGKQYDLPTAQIAYIHKGDYIIHEILTACLRNYRLDDTTITREVSDLKRSLPELLQMVGCPPTKTTGLNIM